MDPVTLEQCEQEKDFERVKNNLMFWVMTEAAEPNFHDRIFEGLLNTDEGYPLRTALSAGEKFYEGQMA